MRISKPWITKTIKYSLFILAIMVKKEIKMFKKLILPIILISFSSSTVLAVSSIVEKDQYSRDEVKALALHKKPISVLKASRLPVGSIIKLNAKIDYVLDDNVYVLKDHFKIIYAYIDPSLAPYGSLYSGVKLQVVGQQTEKDGKLIINVAQLKSIS